MTYLQLVNSVLRRLREREVSSVSDTAYSKLIGDFVNDARAEVEAAWGWSSLRTTFSIPTTANVFNYTLVDSRNAFSVLHVLNDTSNIQMKYQTGIWFDNKFLTESPVATGAPEYYNFNGTSLNNDTQVDVYPIPDGVYNLYFNVVLRGLDMTADSDVLAVPERPVILLALAKAIEERGEDGGTSSMNAYAAGRAALADEISMDAGRRQEDTIWYSV